MRSHSTTPCLFCRITTGELHAHVVYENEHLVAFLDINPIRPGHTQVVPKQHFAYFDDLPHDLLSEVAGVAQSVARALKSIYGVKRVGFAFTGSDVPHAHAHVIPLVANDDLTSRRYIAEEVVTYRNPPRPAQEELVAVANQLREALLHSPASASILGD